MARSPHSSVKVLPATPTAGTFPSGIRVSRRPPPSGLGSLPAFTEARGAFGAVGVVPGSPSLPVFARRKRSVFKGPGLGGSPSAFARTSGSRASSVPRKSGEMIHGITEEDEEELEDDMEVEEVDQFGPELQIPSDNDLAVDDVGEIYTEPASPLSPLPMTPGENPMEVKRSGSGGTRLTAEALALKQQEEEKLARQAGTSEP